MLFRSGRSSALQGRLEDVPWPSDMFLIADGEPRLEWGDHLFTVWHDPSAPKTSFWQYILAVRTVDPIGAASQIEYKAGDPNFKNIPHHYGFTRRGSQGAPFNTGFCDGHVAMTGYNQPSLDKTLIWRRR